jgi:TDG/mug DNA glycosylase family protein
VSEDVLPDVLTAGLHVVFCGTQAGAVSARRGAYYAGPGNKFWKTLFETGLIPEPLGSSDFRELPRYGIGFTDVAKATSGPDTALMRHHVDSVRFLAKIRQFAPAIVAFNGKRAAQAVLEEERGLKLAYGLQPSLLAGSRVFILPSTSGAASGYWSIEPWRELAALVKETSSRR